jgi:hypothetical protein
METFSLAPAIDKLTFDSSSSTTSHSSSNEFSSPYLSSPTTNQSTPQTSGSDGSGLNASHEHGHGHDHDYDHDDDDTDLWDYVDSIYSRIVPDEARRGSGAKLNPNLIDELDGATFGAFKTDRSINRVPLVFPRPPTEEEMLIPHFPELTSALEGRKENAERAIRTSGEYNRTYPITGGNCADEQSKSVKAFSRRSNKRCWAI